MEGNWRGIGGEFNGGELEGNWRGIGGELEGNSYGLEEIIWS
jgi:hypothetical protein